MSLFWSMVGLAVYVLASRCCLAWLRGTGRELAFAILNLAGVYLFLFYGAHNGNPKYLTYLLLMAVQFVTLRLWAGRSGWTPWLAFAVPILALILFHYLPESAYNRMGRAVGFHALGIPVLVGLSYLAFRCSRLALEVRNRTVKMPNVLEYVNFAFFLPTMPVGPINTYANYRRGFATDLSRELPVARSVLRILVGFIKFKFIGSIFNQVTYSNMLLDDHLHHWIDLPIAAVFYYLYLYCNFSGFCDMAIGAAGLIGISVPENFDYPFAARNVKDFWNRWHITLSEYMRDVVFAPLSKFLVHLLGPKQVNHAIALTIFIVFLLIGIWHGVGWNYAAFGLVHALAVVGNHYYTIALKRWLGRDGFKAYNANRAIHAVAILMTFLYCAGSLFLFANSPAEMKAILQELR